MKNIIAISALAAFFLVPYLSISQIVNIEKTGTGSEYVIGTYDANNPEITDTEYLSIEKRCAKNFNLLGLDKNEKNIQSVSLSWPVRAAAGFTDCGYYAISAHVDQNIATGVFQDYNCGTVSYDGHKGTDIFTWPFSFYKMDNSQVEIIAAAPGIILDKADGNFDRNCASNTLPANYVIIQHSDGTRALYWHMKSGSVTTKAIGQTVVVGEYLGVIGSSGSSSGPHLHFEVWTGATSSTYNDPFSGTCNTLNANSWWAVQKQYAEPGILKASVHITDVTFPGCPTTETTNESTTYTIPFQGPGLAPDYAKFYLFMRNIPVGATVDLKILNPNSTIFNSWTYSPTALYKTSYWGWSKHLPATPGNYTFQATYNGLTCSQVFTMVAASSIYDNLNSDKICVSPNPAKDILNIVISDLKNGKCKYILNNILGKEIYRENILIESNIVQKEINISEFSNGIYFLTIDNDNIRIVKKILIQK